MAQMPRSAPTKPRKAPWKAMDHWVPTYPPRTMYSQAMKMERRRHHSGGSPVVAYQTPPAAFNCPTEYMNKKYSMTMAITV